MVKKLLSNGYDVIVIDRNIDKKIDTSLTNEKLTYHECNLPEMDSINLKNVDITGIFHLATHPRSLSMKEPLVDEEVNVKTTIKLLELAREKNAKIILASNCGVYGEPRFIPITEEHPTDPLTIYDANKLVSEYYCNIYHRTYGLSAVVLRLSSVYGEGQKIKSGWNPIIPEIFFRLISGTEMTIFGDGTQTRDFIHVNDVVDGFLQAFRCETIRNGIFNISTESETSLNQLISLLSSKLGKSTKCIFKNPLKNDIHRMSYSYKKAENSFGFRPRYKLSEGLDKYIEWKIASKSLDTSRLT